MSEVTYASGWIHPDDVDELKARNQALLQAVNDCKIFSETKHFQNYSSGYRQGYEECLEEIEEVIAKALEDM